MLSRILKDGVLKTDGSPFGWGWRPARTSACTLRSFSRLGAEENETRIAWITVRVMFVCLNQHGCREPTTKLQETKSIARIPGRICKQIATGLRVSWSDLLPGSSAMPGPGGSRSDPSEGVHRIEDLPRPRVRVPSRDGRRRPCPGYGHRSSRDGLGRRMIDECRTATALAKLARARLRRLGRRCGRYLRRCERWAWRRLWSSRTSGSRARRRARWDEGTVGTGRCRGRRTGFGRGRAERLSAERTSVKGRRPSWRY
jgi:hypothetical protein